MLSKLFKSKLLLLIITILAVCGVVVIGNTMISEILSGNGNDVFRTGMGYELTPLGIAITLFIIPIVVIISKLTSKSDKQMEKEFEDYISKKKDKST